jgi:hypothetical protein
MIMSSPNSLQRRQTGTGTRKQRAVSAGRIECGNGRRLTVLEIRHEVGGLGPGEEMRMAGQLSHTGDEGKDVGVCERTKGKG